MVFDNETDIPVVLGNVPLLGLSRAQADNVARSLSLQSPPRLTVIRDWT